MKKLFILLFFATCSVNSQEPNSKSTSQSDLEYYNLKYITLYDDNSTKIEIAIPSNLKQMSNDRLTNNVIAQFEYLDSSSPSGSGLYNISVDKLESRNTIKFDNEKEWLEIVEKGFYSEYGGSLEEVAKVFPPIFKNLRIVDFEHNLKINGKYFHKQIRYFVDGRLQGTDFENSNVTSFHYYTLHNKRKYSFTISYYGNDKSIADLIGMFNSIAESIKLD